MVGSASSSFRTNVDLKRPEDISRDELHLNSPAAPAELRDFCA
jgi:hypothetical protein